MASLAGKADATIVNAAYAASMAGVPKDYSKQFETMAAAGKTIMTGIKDAYDAYATDKKEHEDELKENVKGMQDFALTIPNKYEHAAFTEEMNKLYTELDENGNYDGDPFKFQEWKYRAERLIASKKNEQNTASELVTAATDPDADLSRLKTEEIQTLNNLKHRGTNPDGTAGEHDKDLNKFVGGYTKKDGTKVEGKPDATANDMWEHLFGKDGKGANEKEVVKYTDPKTGEESYLTATTIMVNGNPVKKIVKYKGSELVALIPQQDKDGSIELNKSLITTGNDAKKSETGLDYTENQKDMTQNDIIEFLNTRIKVDKTFYGHYASKKFGPMKMDFETALRSGQASITPEIITSLQLLNMGFSEDDGDNVLDAGDFAAINDDGGVKNYNAMVDHILKGDSPLAVESLAHHITTEGYEKMWNDNKKIIKKKTVTTNTFTPTTGVNKGAVYTFPREATIDKDRKAVSLIEQVLNGNEKIYNYNQTDPYSLGAVIYTWDEDLKKYLGPQWHSDPERKNPIPRQEFTGGIDGTLIKVHGEGMQPVMTSGPIWTPPSKEEQKIIDEKQKKEEELRKKEEELTKNTLTYNNQTYVFDSNGNLLSVDGKYKLVSHNEKRIVKGLWEKQQNK